MNTLTIEQAAAIIEAFGPCTSLYECVSAKELIREFDESKERNPNRTVNDLVGTLLSVESVSAERMDDTGACYREWKATRPAVIAGLQALGYTLKSPWLHGE